MKRNDDGITMIHLELRVHRQLVSKRIRREVELACNEQPQPRLRREMQDTRPRTFHSPDNFTYHGTSRNCVPFQPKCDEGRGHQDYARDKYCGKVECSVSRKNKIHL